MLCGCLSRLFRRASQTCPLLDGVDRNLSTHTKSEAGEKLPVPEPLDDPDLPLKEEQPLDAALAQTQSTELKEADEKLPSLEKKPTKRTGPPFFRNLFKSAHVDVPPWIHCELHIDEDACHITLKLKFEKWIDDVSLKGTKSQTAASIPFMFLIRGRKNNDEISDTGSKSDSEIDEQNEPGRHKEKSVFCLRWGTTEADDEEDEAIIVHSEAPPGLAGLVNLGNTCFLNAALQCLRCTPGFAGLVVPELENGFEGRCIDDKIPEASKRIFDRSHSSGALCSERTGHWEWEGQLKRRSLPVVLPYEIGGRLEGQTGLAGGSVQRLGSVPDFFVRELSMPNEEADGKLPETNSNGSLSTVRDTVLSSNDPSNNEIKGETSKKEEAETELSTDFISAFRKLVMEVCLGDADHHRNPRDLYQQLKKLPQGEWFCDGGQHDCQEVIKFLLDAIHANYVDITIERPVDYLGRCMSDVSSDAIDALHAIELEILQANTLWKRYLSDDASPITEVFAGQLQIVRSCQKCHCRSTTYEPFWDLSLSLSRERSGWFNPGRMPSSLDDLLRAFTAAEVLQGEEAPFCECCEQKSPATRRILIHRFPKILVINIKRFKYTKDGREKLTSNINFPMRSLRLQNFASKEYQHDSKTELYDLYAVSNHYGTLGGGHYTAYCKVKDAQGIEGWYCFNDKAVNKVTEEAVVTPNAYILFYAKRMRDCISKEL